MSFIYNFTPNDMTAEHYDRVIRKLEEAGAGAPKGRLFHVCYGDTNNLHVVDVWDSTENFDEFGKTLMPILQQVGVDPGEPEVRVAHNIIEAAAELTV